MVEEEALKLYYSIGEVAEMFGVNTSLIRFWEKEFDVIKPHKTKKGNRQFTKADIDNFHLIYHLVKEKGMTLKGAQQKPQRRNRASFRSRETAEKHKRRTVIYQKSTAIIILDL